MNKAQLANLLNTAIMKNEIVDPSSWTQIKEDLSNFADFGITISNLTPAALSNLKQNLVVAVKNETVKRVLDSKTFGMVKSNAKFKATIQRIMASGLYNTQDSHRSNLSWNNGQSWHDGKYYGIGLDSKLFTKTDAFKVVDSISDAEWEQALADASELADLMSLIDITVENTITANLNALVKRLYITMIQNCVNATNARVVHVLTDFNAKHNPGATALTMDDINANRDLRALFDAYIKATLEKLTTYTTDINMKYNDGTVETFTPRSAVEIVALTDFIADVKYISDPIEYHVEGMPAIKQISSWQTTGDALNPTFDDVSKIVVDNNGTSQTISNVVGVIYDTDGIGITTIDGSRNTTVEYVGSEGFTNYHHHVENRYFVDTRLASIVLMLD